MITASDCLIPQTASRGENTHAQTYPQSLGCRAGLIAATHKAETSRALSVLPATSKVSEGLPQAQSRPEETILNSPPKCIGVLNRSARHRDAQRRRDETKRGTNPIRREPRLETRDEPETTRGTIPKRPGSSGAPKRHRLETSRDIQTLFRRFFGGVANLHKPRP